MDYLIKYQNIFTTKDISLTKGNEIENEEDDELEVADHADELRQRGIFCLSLFIISLIVCFLCINQIVQLLQTPAFGIKFLQFAPGEYFFTSLKITAFCSILVGMPILISQIFLYSLPMLNQIEQGSISIIVIASYHLFLMGSIFGYYFLVPSALKFFIVYGFEVVEPFWSFNQYFDFLEVLVVANGLAFQIPIVQIILGTSGLVDGSHMLAAWKPIIVFSTILAAIITPSTDPVTQIILAVALLALYMIGAVFVLQLTKE